MVQNVLNILLLVISCVFAVFQDEAGTIDKHIALIGCPMELAFHKPLQGLGSICYVKTRSNVLAALQCGTGDILWRHVFPNDSSIIDFKHINEQVITTSSDNTMSSWSADLGSNQWTISLPPITSDSKIVTDPDKTVIFVWSHIQVVAVDVLSGSLLWQQTISIAADTEVTLFTDSKSVYVVEVPMSRPSSHIVLTELALTGSAVDVQKPYALCRQCQLVSVANHGKTFSSFIVTRDMYTGLLTLRFPGSGIEHLVQHASHLKQIKLQSASLGKRLILLVQATRANSTSTATIYNFCSDQESLLSKHELPFVGLYNVWALSITDMSVYVVRVHKDDISAYLEVWSSITAERLHYESISMERLGNVDELIVQAEISEMPSSTALAVRAMLATDACDIFMWRNRSIEWIRHEGLASATVIILLPIPTIDLQLTTDFPESSWSKFLRRSHRHFAVIASHLRFGYRQTVTNLSLLDPDHFGLKKYAIAFSESGVYAIDTTTASDVLWHVDLPEAGLHVTYAWRKDDKTETPSSLSTVKVLGHTNRLTLEYSLDITTRIWTLDHSWNSDIRDLHGSLLSDLSRGNVIQLDAHNTTVIARKYSTLIDHIVWTFHAPQNLQFMARTTPVQGEQIASVGRVLGNRGVLYKYLLPYITVGAVNESEKSLTVFVLAAYDGRLLYQETYENVDTSKIVRCVQSENWIVYHFWTGGETNAYQMAVIELFEGKQNMRTQADNDGVHVLSKTFIYDYELSAMAVTTSAQGITTRDVIVSLSSGEIALVPKRLLDPRRPGVDEVDASDKEERLQPYDPIIVLDAPAVLSHKLEIAGIRDITIGTTLLESTALVCAYGLDIFITRITPSMPFDTLSDSFSKAQIVASLCVMLSAILITRPFVKSRSLIRNWKD